MINKGSNSLSEIYKGAAPIDKVMLGTDQIWPATLYVPTIYIDLELDPTVNAFSYNPPSGYEYRYEGTGPWFSGLPVQPPPPPPAQSGLYRLEVRIKEGETSGSNLPRFYYMEAITKITTFILNEDLDAKSMFAGCINLVDISAVDYSNLTNTRNMFSNTGVTSIGNIVLPKATDIRDMFYNCQDLTSVGNITAPLATNITLLFRECPYLQSIGDMDFPEGLTMESFAANCEALTTIGNITCPKVTNFRRMFFSCTSLLNVPLFDTSAGTIFDRMFSQSSNLEHIPAFNTSNGTDFNSMFRYCSSLICIAGIDTTNQTDTTDMFYYCTSLTAPNTTEQTAILAGSNYINTNQCP